MTDIGETGAIIREAIRRAVPALRPYDANSAAKEALAALTTAGVLPGTAPAPCEFLCNHASRPEHST